MWGGKFNLGKFKIYGAFIPKTYFSDPLVIGTNVSPKNKFLDYKDLQIKQIWNRSSLQMVGNYGRYYEPEKHNNHGPYNIKDVMPPPNAWPVYPICTELIIQDFEQVEIKNHSYKWKNCTLKVVTYENPQSIFYVKDINLNFELKELNRYEISFDFADKQANKYILPLYKNYNFKFVDENIYEKEAVEQIEVGKFYIVQDRNYNNFNLSDTIYPIDYGIKNATVFDRIEKCIAKRDFAINFDQNLYSYNCSQLQQYKNKPLSYFINPMTMRPFECNCQEFTKSDGTKVYGDLVIIRKNQIYYKWTRDVAQPHQSLGQQIIIDTKHYPGCFRLVGETRARRRQDGVDERFQFEIPLCKLNSSNNFTFAAEGEPTTYNMSFKALRNSEGVLMKLTQYEVKEECKDNYSYIVPYNTYIPEPEECCDKEAMVSPSEEGIFMFDPAVNNCYEDWLPHRGCHYVPSRQLLEIEILNPPATTVFTVDKDFGNPYQDHDYVPYLRLPESSEEAVTIWEAVQNNSYHDEYRDTLIIKATYSSAPLEQYLTKADIENIEYEFIEGDGQ